MLSNQLSSFELVGVNNSFLKENLLCLRRKRPLTSQHQRLKPAKSQKVDETPEDETTKTMDYGGLPDRNLKKNLGCG